MNATAVPPLQPLDPMVRQINTDASGRPFAPAIVQAVWDRACASKEHAPLRIDPLGALIWREGYGNANSKLGWEIDHIVPVAKGGADDLENLQALQWQNHREKEQAAVQGDASANGG